MNLQCCRAESYRRSFRLCSWFGTSSRVPPRPVSRSCPVAYEDEMRDAGDHARAAEFTESTGLGQDRLTEKGRARANELR
jgi:hypothetical protein